MSNLQYDKTFKAKSITVSRKPGKDKDTFKSAFIGLFNDNNPHLKAKVPIEVIELKEVEKVRFRDLRNISFYLLGNDIVINNLEEITIKQEGNIVTLMGKQNLPK
jgi:hypothetical protein